MSNLNGSPAYAENIITMADAALTLTPDQSGSTIIMPAVTANRIINLPAVGVSIGVNYKFLLSANATKTITVTPTTSVMNGPLNVGAAGAVSVVVKAAAASYVHTATGLLGDWSSVFCDGTSWYCQGQSTAAAGLS